MRTACRAIVPGRPRAEPVEGDYHQIAAAYYPPSSRRDVDHPPILPGDIEQNPLDFSWIDAHHHRASLGDDLLPGLPAKIRHQRCQPEPQLAICPVQVDREIPEAKPALVARRIDQLKDRILGVGKWRLNPDTVG